MPAKAMSAPRSSIPTAPPLGLRPFSKPIERARDERPRSSVIHPPSGRTMSPFLVELRTLVRMSVPVALTQLGLMMAGVIDTLMIGRLGVTELAACALGNMVQ